MNILLLSNSAPNYFHFFNALSLLFMRDGARVVAAVDSTFSREENQLDAVGFEAIYDFSTFFTEHPTDFTILQRYAAFDLNGALLSDFERSEVNGVWGDNVDLDYFDRLKSALLTYFEYIFDRYTIDTVLYEGVSNTFAHYALFVAQRKGARYWGLSGSRLPGRFAVTADPLADDATERLFHDIRSGRLTLEPCVRQWAHNYVEGIENVIPDYMKINGLERIGIVSRYLRRDRLQKVLALARHAFDSRTDAFQAGNPLRTHTGLLLRNVKRRMRAGTVTQFYGEPTEGERFLLYPMHFHPESSTSILAGTYLDEYEVIRNIAFSLPEGMRLYVKDHISAWAYPTRDFYRRIRRLPNVRLLGPNEPTKQLIKQSEGVITLTSTVGYEALILKKQVFLFGTVFYSFHRGVTKVADPTQLRSLLQEKLTTPSEWDDQYNLDFVGAYYLATLPGTLNLMLPSPEANKVAEQVYTQLKFKASMQTSNDPVAA
ncbi:capsular polysaccharide export protein, LipB/KpsS family [Sphingobium baderi]|uniref:Capsule polysaccharide biosynthesis protein n=1 Tax=Sphingobium baderi LL03 TaxID=1114964 RepID=T0HZE7_9SPHN|nr:hypothetical protein [Sphingobium baderi]EQB04745.1 hypothetical protein L485_03870 [Sphingobium baderi LL03]KMS52228.1 hypothetical protein V475_22245 [Sphingobium baderi LL03]